MKQIIINKGRAYIEDCPVPTVNKDAVLVEVHYSCISIGTEMSMVDSSEKTVFNKLLEKPEKIAKGLSDLKNQGITRTIQKIRNMQDSMSAPKQAGYSASGVVIEVGLNVKDMCVGDRVACAGAGIANHAEYIEVPRNLIARIPDNLGLDSASTVTLGAIAMQGVRRANVTLGENVAVIGLGILGQIAVQLLKASGCRVIGMDLDEKRIEQSVTLGMDYGVNPKVEDIVKRVNHISDGYGVDKVIITAATMSSEPLAQAFQMCRKKGKVILVGVVGMEIKRDDMYMKELDFLISTSYGPGRYDERYENKGLDYPYAYVRWTENRNMQEYLKLLAEKKIDINSLIDKVYKIEDAPEAYDELKNAERKPLITLLKYDQDKKCGASKKIEVSSGALTKAGKINIAIIGAGGFAKGMHLPNLHKLDDYNIYAIASRTGSNASITAKKYGAKYATTDYKELLMDKDLDAVIIATRHDLHAKIAADFLKSGKAVFLEKPMAMNKEELNGLVSIIKETQKPFMVGFNRRFSKYAQEAKRHISNRINPMIINYQMNAGYIPLDNWVQTEEGGGRIIGEACHIFDLFNYFTDAEIESISVDRIAPKSEHISSGDNAVITLKSEDGSLCTLTYTSLGNNQYPKEICSIFVDGKIIIINDYKKMEGYGVKLKKIESVEPDKGQREQLIEFARYVKGEIGPPIPLWQMIQATETSFLV